MQIKLSADYEDAAKEISQINPMEFLKTNEITRSDYFATGFYPLNSIIQVVILSPEDTSVSNIQGNILDTQTVDGEKIPTELTRNGWVFDPKEGQKIQGMFIFGEKVKIDEKELKFSLGEQEKPTPRGEPITEEFDESMIVVTIIAIVAIAAALYYLKGYKK